MQPDLGFCSQCGAQGEIGTECEYCGSIISDSQLLGNHSMIESWSDYQLDGFSIVCEKLKGYTDVSEVQVLKGNRSGKYGLVNRYGNIVIPCIYDQIMVYLDYHLCTVSIDYKNAIYDTDGNVVIPFGDVNPMGVFVIQNNLIVGYNTIFDLQGNIKVSLPSYDRIVLVSELYASTFPDARCLYDVESGDQLLSREFRIDKIIDTHLLIVNKVFDGFTRYGIYDAVHRKFVLKLEYSSILKQGNKRYVARAQTDQNNGVTQSITLTFSVDKNKVVIQKQDIQNMQTGSGIGCLSMLSLILLITFSLYWIV